MDWWIPALAAGLGLGFALGRLRARRDLAATTDGADAQARREPVASEAASIRPEADEASGGAAHAADDHAPDEAAAASPGASASAEPLRLQLLRRAEQLERVYQGSAHPDDLLVSPAWNACVGLLAGPDFTYDEVLGYLIGSSSLLACAAAQAIGTRAEVAGRERELVQYLGERSVYAGWFLLPVIERVPDASTPFDVMLAVDAGWDTPLGVDLLRGYLARRLDAAFAAAPQQVERLRACADGHRDFLGKVVRPLDTAAARAVAAAIDRGRTDAGGLAALRGFTRVLAPADCTGADLPSPTQAQARSELDPLVRADPARPILFVGEPGVGKATVTRQLAAALLAEGWTVFEAGATQLLAGQSYVGQLEQRVLDLVQAVGGKPNVLWIAPGLAEFASAGRHKFSAVGLLDLLLPHLTTGRLRLLAPITTAAHEQLLRQVPVLRTAAATVRLPAAGTDETLAMGRAWLADTAQAGPRLCDESLLHELFQRTQQHVTHEARPGSLLALLAALRAQVVPPGAPARAATLDDAITLLSRLTGLPASVLDDRTGLDLASIRRAFAARVLGQPEAVDCLVERIAMLKAGLCDPRRPIGVFLFTGPTGTGKTELCRALAEYLFGSSDRMLRLDMSEFQHPESIGLLLGDQDDVHGRTALVHRIREQPFAVVLLDEIEKAHPMVFDLFLQVFDEGRLTDRSGRLGDFRHAIVIMTSNLGVRDLEGADLGFGSGTPTLQRALEGTFRREFLNRIDRLVVFRALDRDTLRAVLLKELDLVLDRRGLRQRQWAVEWDETALQFLLEQGCSPELGARPLRRAIERHVLAPLAAAIVSDRVPAGDQFLLVRSDGRGVQVEFLDPEATIPTPRSASVAAVSRSLRALARDGIGNAAELAAVHGELAALAARLTDGTWRMRKEAAYAAMNSADFWARAGRHRVLGQVELTSRIETAVERAHARAARASERGGVLDRDDLRALATRALLLQLAVTAIEREEPQDAYLSVAAVHDPHASAATAAAFAADIAGMYESWAKRRGMHWQVLEAGEGTTTASITGFAAWPILAGESGLHVLDSGDDQRPVRVRVVTAPQPPEPADDAEAAQAQRALRAAEAPVPVVVRRYRKQPSPEVRDRVRGWRTGRLDRVLAGEFDVLE